jgi:hypothetical protein
MRGVSEMGKNRLALDPRRDRANGEGNSGGDPDNDELSGLDDVVDDGTGDVGEAEVGAGVVLGGIGVVDSHAVEDCVVEVVVVTSIVDGAVFDAAAR